MIEKAVAEQLQAFLDKSSALQPLQSDSRPGYRRETAAGTLVGDI